MTESGGMCISCLETENIFNIFDTHECEGIQEIYVEMLQSCFNLEISKNESINYMCEKCILILRTAFYFKEKIVNNLKDFAGKEEEYLELNQLNVQIVQQELDPTTGELYFHIENNEFPNDEACTDIITKCDSFSQANDNYRIFVKQRESFSQEEEASSVINSKEENLLPGVKKEKIESKIVYVNDEKRKNNGAHIKYEETPSEGQETEYECAHCNKRFPSKVAIGRHVKTHLEGPFTCHICNQVFSKWNTCHSHMWRAHQHAPYACGHCDQRFPTFHKRLVHLKEVHGVQKEYPCPYCDNMFSYAGARSTHIRAVHLRVHNHPCPEPDCKSAFFKRRGLLNHLASIHGIGEKKFVCPICGKSFYRNPILRNHMKCHMDKPRSEVKYKCSVCSAEFTYQAILKNHMKCHLNELEENTDLPQEYDSIVENFDDCRVEEGKTNIIHFEIDTVETE